MIAVTRLNGMKYYINAELIKAVEETPDTIITLVNDQKVVVRDALEQVIERVIEYRRRVNTPWTGSANGTGGSPD